MLETIKLSFLKILSLTWIIALSYPSYGQEVYKISLNEAIEKAASKNLNIKLSEKDMLVSKSDLRSAKDTKLPNIMLSYTGITTNNPLMAFGSKLNQERITESDFNPNLLNDPSRIENFTTRIEVQQPLINLDIKHHIRASEAKVAATEFQYKRTREGIAFEIEKVFLQLQLSYKMLDVLTKSKETAGENLRIAQNNFNQGILSKADLLSAEVRLTEIDNQILVAYSNIDNLSNMVMFLMGETGERRLQPLDDLELYTDEISQYSIPEDRADLLAMKKVSEAYQAMHEATKKNSLPRLNGFASYELHDDGLFQGQGEGYLIGVSLSWNILGNKKDKGKIQKSKAEYEISRLKLQQYVDQNQTELNRAIRSLEIARLKISLVQQSLDQSRESLRIRNNRYKQGLEKTTDLLMAETSYAQKQLEYYSAIYDHNQAILHIKFLTKI